MPSTFPCTVCKFNVHNNHRAIFCDSCHNWTHLTIKNVLLLLDLNTVLYYVNTSEIPSKHSCENFISSHVKRSPSLWLHNKSRLWKQADLVFNWCLYNKQNILINRILAYGYEFYLLVFNSISHSFAAFTHEISSWPLEDKIHIHARACNILYII